MMPGIDNTRMSVAFHMDSSQAVASSVQLTAFGYILWAIRDVTGMLRSLKLPAVLAPSVTVRLLSIPALMIAYPDEQVTFSHHYIELSGNTSGIVTTCAIRVYYNAANHLPTSFAYRTDELKEIPRSIISAIFEVSWVNIN